jgi:hypothetical protein
MNATRTILQPNCIGISRIPFLNSTVAAQYIGQTPKDQGWYMPPSGKSEFLGSQVAHLVLTLSSDRIESLVMQLFAWCVAETHRWLQTDRSLPCEEGQISEVLSVGATDNEITPMMSQDTLTHLLASPLEVGPLSFTYNVAHVRDSCMIHESWVPCQEFRAGSLAQLMDELPEARNATGLRITVSGPGFRIRGLVFAEHDFQRLKVEFNDQVCRLLVMRDSVQRNISVHVQLFILKDVPPAFHWIFST